MSTLHIAVDEAVPEALKAGLDRLRTSLGVPDVFPADVEAEAAAAASRVALPDADRTDLEFVTIDPEGSMDLDQALHLARRGDGYVVHYAIADVAGFVAPGGALDAECRRRGQTLYAPTRRTPLHPAVLSEGAASLLPDQARPALLWEIALDAAGAVTSATVGRAVVKSRARLSYAGVQADLDAGRATPMLQLLAEIGKLRQAQEVARGGVSLNAPEQVVVPNGDDWELEFRRTLPVEDYNAQISLLTGMAAAKIMLDGGVGLLRTLPPTAPEDVERLRRVAQGLRLSWPASLGYPEFVRSLDASKPREAAMLVACTRLFRGAGYASFEGTPPDQPLHGALASPYAHVTAPLRRLVDRFASEACLALCAGREVPAWVREALPTLPDLMAASDARAKKYERGIVDLVEALVLAPQVGRTLTGVVVETDARGGIVQLSSPAVQGRFSGRGRLGAELSVRVESVDLQAGTIELKAV